MIGSALPERAPTDPVDGDLAVEQRAVYGLPAAALTQIARDERASLIVIGAPCRERGSLLRSLPLRSALGAAAPVLAVREAGSILRWLDRQYVLRIMIAIDRTEAAKTTMEWAAMFAGGLPVEVVAAGLDPSVRPPHWDGTAAVLDAARRWKADLLVAGIRRGGAFASWRRRTPAERLVDEAPMNIVAVPVT
jgi:nucleotide-binding universal stress UspA family protein